MRRAAVSEAVAHLMALSRRGVVTEEVGEPSRWALSERAEGLLDANGGTRHWTT